MGMDVATFAKQLREDGIEAAKSEAAKIIADARKEAEKIVSNAQAEVAKLEKEARHKIEQEKVRSEDEMKLVARDLVSSFRKRIEEVGARLLKAKVAEGLNEKEVVKTAISEMLKTQPDKKDWEVSLGAKVGKPLADVVMASFKEKGAVAKLGQELTKAGFEMKAGGSSEVFELTDESVTETFKKLLSPELKKLLA
jgi:V/A-type H+-transporting ATPase subunit E